MGALRHPCETRTQHLQIESLLSLPLDEGANKYNFRRQDMNLHLLPLRVWLCPSVLCAIDLGLVRRRKMDRPGFDPGSPALQAGAFTRLAYDPYAHRDLNPDCPCGCHRSLVYRLFQFGYGHIIKCYNFCILLFALHLYFVTST